MKAATGNSTVVSISTADLSNQQISQIRIWSTQPETIKLIKGAIQRLGLPNVKEMDDAFRIFLRPARVEIQPDSQLLESFKAAWKTATGNELIFEAEEEDAEPKQQEDVFDIDDVNLEEFVADAGSTEVFDQFTRDRYLVLEEEQKKVGMSQEDFNEVLKFPRIQKELKHLKSTLLTSDYLFLDPVGFKINSTAWKVILKAWQEWKEDEETGWGLERNEPTVKETQENFIVAPASVKLISLDLGTLTNEQVQQWFTDSKVKSIVASTREQFNIPSSDRLIKWDASARNLEILDDELLLDHFDSYRSKVEGVVVDEVNPPWSETQFKKQKVDTSHVTVKEIKEWLKSDIFKAAVSKVKEKYNLPVDVKDDLLFTFKQTGKELELVPDLKDLFDKRFPDLTEVKPGKLNKKEFNIWAEGQNSSKHILHLRDKSGIQEVRYHNFAHKGRKYQLHPCLIADFEAFKEKHRIESWCAWISDDYHPAIPDLIALTRSEIVREMKAKDLLCLETCPDFLEEVKHYILDNHENLGYSLNGKAYKESDGVTWVHPAIAEAYLESLKPKTEEKEEEERDLVQTEKNETEIPQLTNCKPKVTKESELSKKDLKQLFSDVPKYYQPLVEEYEDYTRIEILELGEEALELITTEEYRAEFVRYIRACQKKLVQSLIEKGQNPRIDSNGVLWMHPSLANLFLDSKEPSIEVTKLEVTPVESDHKEVTSHETNSSKIVLFKDDIIEGEAIEVEEPTRQQITDGINKRFYSSYVKNRFNLPTVGDFPMVDLDPSYHSLFTKYIVNKERMDYLHAIAVAEGVQSVAVIKGSVVDQISLHHKIFDDFLKWGRAELKKINCWDLDSVTEGDNLVTRTLFCEYAVTSEALALRQKLAKAYNLEPEYMLLSINKKTGMREEMTNWESVKSLDYSVHIPHEVKKQFILWLEGRKEVTHQSLIKLLETSGLTRQQFIDFEKCAKGQQALGEVVAKHGIEPEEVFNWIDRNNPLVHLDYCDRFVNWAKDSVKVLDSYYYLVDLMETFDIVDTHFQQFNSTEEAIKLRRQIFGDNGIEAVTYEGDEAKLHQDYRDLFVNWIKSFPAPTDLSEKPADYQSEISPETQSEPVIDSGAIVVDITPKTQSQSMVDRDTKAAELSCETQSQSMIDRDTKATEVSRRQFTIFESIGEAEPSSGGSKSSSETFRKIDNLSPQYYLPMKELCSVVNDKLKEMGSSAIATVRSINEAMAYLGWHSRKDKKWVPCQGHESKRLGNRIHVKVVEPLAKELSIVYLTAKELLEQTKAVTGRQDISQAALGKLLVAQSMQSRQDSPTGKYKIWVPGTAAIAKDGTVWVKAKSSKVVYHPELVDHLNDNNLLSFDVKKKKVTKSRSKNSPSLLSHSLGILDDLFSKSLNLSTCCLETAEFLVGQLNPQAMETTSYPVKVLTDQPEINRIPPNHFLPLSPESRSTHVLPKSEQEFVAWLQTDESRSLFSAIAAQMGVDNKTVYFDHLAKSESEKWWVDPIVLSAFDSWEEHKRKSYDLSYGRIQLSSWSKKDTAIVHDDNDLTDTEFWSESALELPLGYKPWIDEWLQDENEWEKVCNIINKLEVKTFIRDEDLCEESKAELEARGHCRVRKEDKEGSGVLTNHLLQFDHAYFGENKRDPDQKKIVIIPPLLNAFDEYCKDIAVLAVEDNGLYSNKLYPQVPFKVNYKHTQGKEGEDSGKKYSPDYSFVEWLNSKECEKRAEFGYEEDEEYRYMHKSHYTFDLSSGLVFTTTFDRDDYRNWAKNNGFTPQKPEGSEVKTWIDYYYEEQRKRNASST